MGGYKTGEFGDARDGLRYYFPQGTIIRKPATAIDTCHLQCQLRCLANIHVSHTKTVSIQGVLISP